MRKILLVSTLIISIFALIMLTTKPKATNAKEVANGYRVEEVIREKFNKEELDSSWRLNDATLNFNYNGLHCISPVDYGSGPIINKERLSDKTCYRFTIYPTEGASSSNISFTIGVPSPSAPLKEPDVDCRIQFWDNQFTFCEYQNNLVIYEEAGHVIRGFNGLFSDLEPTDVSLYITRKSESLTEIYTEYRRNDEIVFSTKDQPFKLLNPRYPNGYCGFFWDVLEMDIVDFRVYQNDKLSFEDDFSSNTLTYPSTDASLGNFHINSVLNESNVYISRVSSVLMDSANESLVNSYKLTKKANVSNPYSLTYKFRINELNPESFVGFGFGMNDADTKIDAVNAIGFIKYDDQTAEVVTIKNGEVDRSNNYQVALAKLGIGKYQTFQISLDYANNAYLTINNTTFKFSNIDFYGETGLGLIDLGGEKSSSAELKEFSLMKNEYKYTPSEDAVNDLQGKKDPENYDEYPIPYINTQKYFVGSGSSVEEDWTTGEQSISFVNAGPYSGFGYRKEYSEFILEFDLEVVSHTSNQFIGVSFGRQSVVDLQVQASNSSSMFYFRCDPIGDGTFKTINLLYGNGIRFSNGTDWMESSINIYDLENTKYHLMFIAKNRSVSVYAKGENDPDEDLGILRAYIPNVNINGYCSIVGNNSATFNVTNYKLVNLSDDCTEESDVTLRESFDSLGSVSDKIILDQITKVKDEMLVMNNSTLQTLNYSLYEIIRFTTFEMEDSLEITFSEDKKIILDAYKNEIVIKEGDKKTAYNASDINLYNVKGKRFEIRIQGDEISIGYKGYYDPQDKLSETLINYKVASPITSDYITFSSNGKTVIDDLYLFALDNSQRCTNVNYLDDPDNASLWEVKKDFDPTKVYDPTKKVPEEDKPIENKEKGCKSALSISALTISLVGAIFFIKRKEEK